MRTSNAARDADGAGDSDSFRQRQPLGPKASAPTNHVSPIDRFIDALKAQGFEPRRSGKSWSCRCPAHDDRTPSLSVAEGEDGRVLVNCHAGCAFEKIVAAVRLEPADLFPPPGGTTTRTRATGQSAPVWVARDLDKLADRLGRSFGGPPDRLWTYCSVDGEVVGAVCRWEATATRDKQIRPIAHRPDGTYAPEGLPAPRPLLHLPQLADSSRSEPVLVVEGETCVDAARKLGFIATTSAGGSNAADKTDWSPLAGRDVAILPDNDDAGQCYADTVAQLLAEAGARSIRIVDLADLWPDLPPCGDLVDLVADRGMPGEIAASVRTLIDRTEPLSPPDPRPAFPTDALPPVLAGMVREVARAIPCDESMVATLMLPLLAAAVGNTREVEVKPGWREPMVIWAIVVARSGTAKSPVLRALRRPLDAWEATQLLEHERLKDDHADDEDWMPPPVPQLCLGDATAEAMAKELQTNPRGLVIINDELGLLLGSLERYQAGASAAMRSFLLSCFSAEPVKVNRKTTESLRVPRGSLSIAGLIPPKVLDRLLGDDDIAAGLLARFLVCTPRPVRLRFTDACVSETAAAAYTAVWDCLSDLQPAAVADDWTGGYTPVTVPLSTGARQVFRRFYDRIGWTAAEVSDDEGASVVKLGGVAARLALLLHLVERAADQMAGDGQAADQVAADTMARAVQIVEWFEQRALGLLRGEPVDAPRVDGLSETQLTLMHRLVKATGATPEGVPARALYRNLAPFKGKGGGERAQADLDRLVELGHVERVPSEGGRTFLFRPREPDGDAPHDHRRPTANLGDTTDASTDRSDPREVVADELSASAMSSGPPASGQAPLLGPCDAEPADEPLAEEPRPPCTEQAGGEP